MLQLNGEDAAVLLKELLDIASLSPRAQVSNIDGGVGAGA